MTEVPFDREQLKAVIFDLDGTLYRQNSLRQAMFLRLVGAYATRPLVGLRTVRVLGAYRRAQELLRDSSTDDSVSSDLAGAQLRLAAERTRMEPRFVADCVARWMDSEPLALLARRIQPGLTEFLAACKARGLKLGVLSDYPAEAKLKALGLDRVFDLVLSAQSPTIGVFKPHPRGLLVAMERLQVSSRECVYVGDRAEVDAAAAAEAGVTCFILERPSEDPLNSRTWIQVAGFPQLHELALGPGHK